MTIFSETCVVAHICSPRTLVQGQESQSQQSQPGLNKQDLASPRGCLYSHLTAVTLSLKLPLDHKVAATDPAA